MICRCGTGIRRFRAIDVCRDWLCKDVQAVQLVHGAGDLGQCFSEGVVLLIRAVVGQDGVEDALEEAMAGMVGMQDSDGGDGDWGSGVERDLEGSQRLTINLNSKTCSYQLILSSFCFLIGSMHAVVDSRFPLFHHLGIYRFAELLEDL